MVECIHPYCRKMAKISPEVLIPLIEKRSVLWDRNLEAHRDKRLKTAAWREICCILNPDFEKLDEQERNDYTLRVTTKWIYIRDAFVRSLKRQQEEKLSKAGSKQIRPYIYKNQMLFYLNVNTTPRNRKARYFSSDDDDDEEASTRNSVSDLNSDCEMTVEYKSTPAKDILPSPAKKKMIDPVEADPLDAKVVQQFQDYKEEHPLIFFIKGILPSLATFDDDENLEFQAGILALIQNIRKKRQSNVDHHNHGERRRCNTNPAPSSSTRDITIEHATRRSTSPAISKREVASDYETFDD